MVQQLPYIAAIAFLCGILLAMLIIQHIERKDLYNRLMAKDLTEYQTPITKLKGKPGNFLKNRIEEHIKNTHNS